VIDVATRAGEHYAGFVRTLREASALGAFTELTPYHPRGYLGYNDWNEPAHQQAVLLVPISIAYLIARWEEPHNPERHASIKEGGDAIFASASGGKDDFVGRASGMDPRSLKPSGYAFWGNASSNSKALSMAYKDYWEVLGNIRSGGADSREAWANSNCTRPI
jgi:hypothetical protein